MRLLKSTFETASDHWQTLMALKTLNAMPSFSPRRELKETQCTHVTQTQPEKQTWEREREREQKKRPKCQAINSTNKKKATENVKVTETENRKRWRETQLSNLMRQRLKQQWPTVNSLLIKSLLACLMWSKLMRTCVSLVPTRKRRKRRVRTGRGFAQHFLLI